MKLLKTIGCEAPQNDLYNYLKDLILLACEKGEKLWVCRNQRKDATKYAFQMKINSKEISKKCSCLFLLITSFS